VLPGFVPQLSLLVAMGLMGLSIAVLVFFLNHIPASIRINTVLEGIGRQLIEDIGKIYPDPNKGRQLKQAPTGQPVLAVESGYIQMIDFEGMAARAKAAETRIALGVRTGDFVHPGMMLAQVCDNEVSDDLADCVRSEFTFGATRTPGQDPQFLIDELVEIALRALSPGTNDPFTAITSMHWLGTATAYLGTQDLQKYVVDSEDEDAPRVIPLPDDFEHYLARGFGNVRTAAATSPAAALVMLDTLRNAAAPINDETRKASLKREGLRLIEQVREHLSGPDLQEVEARYVLFAEALTG